MVNGQTQSLVATELGMPEYVIVGSNDGNFLCTCISISCILSSYHEKAINALYELSLELSTIHLSTTQRWGNPA